MSEKKQPWNPFPLAALSAADKFDLSPCATQIVHYLAARSNYTGWTCVGQDRVAHDLRRSRDYVTKGFQELREKKIIDTRSRARKSKQGDWCLITQELLPEEWRKCNPVGQENNSSPEEICDPDLPVCNPAQQEDISKCNPVFGNEILPSRTKPYSINLTESQPHNLAVVEPKSQNQVSELVSEDSSVAPLPRSVGERENPLHDEGMPQYSKRLGRMFDAGEWDIVMDLYQTLLPNDSEAKIRGFDDKELLLLAEVSWDIQHRYSPRAMGNVNRATGEMQTEEHVKVVTAQDFWHWNHTHKKGKLKFLSMADMAKAWWSADPRCGRVQWENDDPDTCPICTRLRSKAKQDKDNSNPLPQPPVATAPQPSNSDTSETLEHCPHGNEWGRCKTCDELEAERNQCQHGNRSTTCYQCSHPLNADCGWKECGKQFHSKSRLDRFCSSECKAEFEAREKEMMAKYAKPASAPFNGLAAFLDGREDA
jgi:hypothetical protein